MICELTRMDVTNSGMYDVFNSIDVVANLAVGRVKKTNKVLISKAVHRQGIENLKTYAFGKEYEVEEVHLNQEITDLSDLKNKLDEETAAVIVQYPNFFGSIEDLKEIKECLENTKTLLIVSANPLALGQLESPGKLGADIVVGDMQPFGIPMSFGGQIGRASCREGLWTWAL